MAIEIDLGLAEGWRILSDIHMNVGNYEEALRASDREIELSPTPSAWIHRLASVFTVHDIPTALEVWQGMDKNYLGAVSFSYLWNGRDRRR